LSTGTSCVVVRLAVSSLHAKFSVHRDRNEYASEESPTDEHENSEAEVSKTKMIALKAKSMTRIDIVKEDETGPESVRPASTHDKKEEQDYSDVESDS